MVEKIDTSMLRKEFKQNNLTFKLSYSVKRDVIHLPVAMNYLLDNNNVEGTGNFKSKMAPHSMGNLILISPSSPDSFIENVLQGKDSTNWTQIANSNSIILLYNNCDIEQEYSFVVSKNYTK